MLNPCFTRRLNPLVLALTLGSFCSAAILPAHASTWPDRPVKLVVPFPAGGSSDALARILAQRLSDAFKQSFIVENRAGAGGTIGTAHVAKASPDGSTFLVSAGGSLVVSPLLTPQSYDTLRDLAPVTQLISSPMAVAINVAAFDGKVGNIAELVAQAKQRGNITFGSGGNGTQMHLAGELFNELTQSGMTHVPYKGAAPAITDLIGGHVPVIFVDLASIVPMMDNKEIKVLGIASTTPSKIRPDLATTTSSLAQWKASGWIGLLAPANTPPAIIDKLEQQVNAILQEEEVIKRIMTTGNEPAPSNQRAFLKHIQDETDQWKEVIKRANVKM